MWTYMDVFVMAASVGLSTRFKQINDNLMQHKGEVTKQCSRMCVQQALQTHILQFAIYTIYILNRFVCAPYLSPNKKWNFIFIRSPCRRTSGRSVAYNIVICAIYARTLTMQYRKLPSSHFRIICFSFVCNC